MTPPRRLLSGCQSLLRKLATACRFPLSIGRRAKLKIPLLRFLRVPLAFKSVTGKAKVTMDAVLRNFKMIPCPAGDQCTKPGCQWAHSWDRKPASEPTDTKPSTVPSTPASTSTSTSPTASPAACMPTGGAKMADEEDGPRKRRRVLGDPIAEQAFGTHASDLKSGRGPVSPPPLKRKVPARTGPPANAEAPSPSTQSPARASDEAPTPPRPAPAPRKPESLNPRHLKSAAPASHEFRYRVLKMLHDQFERLNKELERDATDEEAKLLMSAQELIWHALDEEQKVATEKPLLYSNIIKNRIMTYKRMSVAAWRDERRAELKKKEEAAAAAQAATTRAPAKRTLGEPIVVDTGLTPAQEVEMLARLITPTKGLEPHGYVVTPPTDAQIAKAREGEEASLGWEVCDRCTTRFQVFPGRREEDGALASGGECTYHHGRIYYPDRPRGATEAPEKRYRCCQKPVSEADQGCATAKTHVFMAKAPNRLAALVPFVETPPNPLAPTDRAVCFDCEMGYTVRGFELVRLTAISWPDEKLILDVLVKPIGEVLDLNSRYSGVWPEDIVNAIPWTPGMPLVPVSDAAADGASDKPAKKKKLPIVSSPMAARELLFSLISPDTPLIGHGLENDLNATRIVHPTLIDTALLYPHRRGLPFRQGLKMLMEKSLNKAIQTGGDQGHDSAEDARAAGELVKLRVKEEWTKMRLEGWSIENGKIVGPGGVGLQGQGQLTEEFLEEHEEGVAVAAVA